MSKNEPPCKDCADRTAGCHGTCSRYKDWHEQHVQKQREIRSKQEEENTFRAYKVGVAVQNRKRRAHGENRK